MIILPQAQLGYRQLGSIELESLRLFFQDMTTSAGGDVNHGPYVISDDSVSLIAGDRVLFDWRARNGSDDYDVYAYLLEENTGGNTIELLDANAQEVQHLGERVM